MAESPGSATGGGETRLDRTAAPWNHADVNIDPEIIMGGVNWSVQLIGLLSAWKQDRTATSDDQFQDFMIWLENHNFHELSRKIFESEEVNRELHALLSLSIGEINGKLDAIALAIGGLTAQIDGLNSLDRAVFADKSTLSTQAREILKLFADRKNDTTMLFTGGGIHGENLLVFFPSQFAVTMDEPRFLENDLEDLLAAGLIMLSDYSNSGNPIYSMTRPGAQLAKSLPAVEIREE